MSCRTCDKIPPTKSHFCNSPCEYEMINYDPAGWIIISVLVLTGIIYLSGNKKL
jgi:hypothetical protein